MMVLVDGLNGEAGRIGGYLGQALGSWMTGKRNGLWMAQAESLCTYLCGFLIPASDPIIITIVAGASFLWLLGAG